jgi:hypothetical protein
MPLRERCLEIGFREHTFLWPFESLDGPGIGRCIHIDK